MCLVKEAGKLADDWMYSYFRESQARLGKSQVHLAIAVGPRG